MSTIVLIMRTERPVKLIGDLLFGQTRGGVLTLLYGHPDEKFYVRQIARLVGVSVGAVQRELETLSGVQLVNRSKTGSQVFYQANHDNPVFPELRVLIAKTMGIYQMIQSALFSLEQRISWAFVYGSMARQEEKAHSDIDLMLVGDLTLEDVMPGLAKVERESGREINPTIYSVEEFKSRLIQDNHFLKSVMRGRKITLIGDENEFGKVG